MKRKKIFWIIVIIIALGAATYLLFREKWALPSFASYFNPFFDPSKNPSAFKKIGDSVSEIKNAVKNSAGVNYFEKFLSDSRAKFKTRVDDTINGALNEGNAIKEKSSEAIKNNLGEVYRNIGDFLGISSSTCR